MAAIAKRRIGREELRRIVGRLGQLNPHMYYLDSGDDPEHIEIRGLGHICFSTKSGGVSYKVSRVMGLFPQYSLEVGEEDGAGEKAYQSGIDYSIWAPYSTRLIRGLFDRLAERVMEVGRNSLQLPRTTNTAA